MRIWRLSNLEFAQRFDGGFGLYQAGRWNGRGRCITYCATGPALCALERLAHAEKVAHLPQHVHLVCYEVPDDIHVEVTEISSLPEGWSRDQELTRQVGNAWLDSESSCLLKVPSVLVPVAESDDRNVLVNHKHEDVGRIRINQIAKFKFDERLL